MKIKYFLLLATLLMVLSTPLLALHGRHLEMHKKSPFSLFMSKISVGGFVKSPGGVEFAENMTLVEAIKAAGGPTPFASIRRVQLIRDGKRFVYDMRKSRHQQVRILPDDCINVPQKAWFGR